MAVVVILCAAIAVAVAGPWFDHLGLSWPGGSSAAPGGSGGAASADGSLRIVGAEDLWHDGPATLHFRDADGKSVAASYRIDAGAWQEGRRVHVRAPEDHSGDGMHTVEARPLGGGDVVASVKVGIDTMPPEITAAKVSPDRIDGSGTVTLSFTTPPEDGATVEWAVVDALDKPVGEQGAPAAPAGAATLNWRVPKVDGEALGPGTYWLRVLAKDRAGNVTEERAAIACIHRVKARIITSLPAAGKEVALTFDGDSGYAWRSLMNELYSHDQLGTFFCTGVSVDKYNDMAQLAVDQRQTIGNHSYDHPDFSTISYSEQVSQLKRNSDAWWKACKAIPQPFFRPPYWVADSDHGQGGRRLRLPLRGDVERRRRRLARHPGLAGRRERAGRRQAWGDHRLPHRLGRRRGAARRPQRPEGQGPQSCEPGAALRRRRPALLTSAPSRARRERLGDPAGLLEPLRLWVSAQ